MQKFLYIYIWSGALYAADTAPPLPTEKRVVHIPALISLLETHDDRAHTLRNGLGENYLHYACRSGNAPMIEVLLKHNFPLHEQDKFGMTALYYALRSEYDAFQTGSPRSPAFGLLLLQKGHNPTYCGPAYTPLMYAALFGLYSVAQKLLELGAPVNSIDKKSGYTALMFAARQNKPKIARLLLRYGAATNIVSQAKPAMEWAVEWRDKGLPELFEVIQHTQPNIQLILGENPMVFLAHREFGLLKRGRLKKYF
jgi:ankyrin repeat protein